MLISKNYFDKKSGLWYWRPLHLLYLLVFITSFVCLLPYFRITYRLFSSFIRQALFSLWSLPLLENKNILFPRDFLRGVKKRPENDVTLFSYLDLFSCFLKLWRSCHFIKKHEKRPGNEDAYFQQGSIIFVFYLFVSQGVWIWILAR